MTKAEIKNLNDVLRAGVEYGKENRLTYTYFQNRLKVSHSCFYKWLKGKFNFKEKKENIKCSLFEVEHFLRNIHKASDAIALFKILKKPAVLLIKFTYVLITYVQIVTTYHYMFINY